MGRKSTFATGGGFLNEVDATIVAYRFTDDFVDPNGVVYPYDPAKKIKGFKSSKMQPVPHGVNIVLSLLVDGAEDAVTQCLRVASDYDKWSISDDEQSLTPEVDGARLGGSSAGGKFIQSWETAAKDGAMSEDESVINFAPIVGSRVRLVQRDYTAAEIESIKKLGGTEKRKGKDGKEYSRQSLCVDQVYEQAKPEVKANGKLKTPPVNQAKPLGIKTGGAARPTPTTSSTTSTVRTTSPSEDIDIKEVAGAALVEIISRVGKNGLLDKRKLSVQTFMTPLLKGKPYRDDVQKFLFNDDNLAEFASEGIAVGDTAYDVTFDKVKQTIQVEAQ